MNNFEYRIQGTTLSEIADAIREKTGKNDGITAAEMAAEISSINNTGAELPELTNEGSASDLLSGKQLIDQEGNVVTGTIVQQDNNNLSVSGPTITIPAGYYKNTVEKSVNSGTLNSIFIGISNSGLITANLEQTESGYINAGASRSSSKQLPTVSGGTITPSKDTQLTIKSGTYITEAITFDRIPDKYIATDDATASADEIMSGETAYVNGSKVTGTFSIDSELSTQDDLIAQIITALKNKISGGALTSSYDENGNVALSGNITVNNNNGNVVLAGNISAKASDGNIFIN